MTIDEFIAQSNTSSYESSTGTRAPCAGVTGLRLARISANATAARALSLTILTLGDYAGSDLPDDLQQLTEAQNRGGLSLALCAICAQLDADVSDVYSGAVAGDVTIAETSTP